jgi:hypothetical protein
VYQLALDGKPVTAERLLTYLPSRPQEALFQHAYLDPLRATADLEQVTSDVEKYQPDECTIFPPLFVRYNGYVSDADERGGKPRTDHLIPVKVEPGGKLSLNLHARPDVILHFKATSQSIILSVCSKPSPKDLLFQSLSIMINTLYAMRGPGSTPMSVDNIVRLYEQSRLAKG